MLKTISFEKLPWCSPVGLDPESVFRPNNEPILLPFLCSGSPEISIPYRYEVHHFPDLMGTVVPSEKLMPGMLFVRNLGHMCSDSFC